MVIKAANYRSADVVLLFQFFIFLFRYNSVFKLTSLSIEIDTLSFLLDHFQQMDVFEINTTYHPLKPNSISQAPL